MKPIDLMVMFRQLNLLLEREMHQQQIISFLDNLNRKMDIMSLDFTRLVADVSSQTDVVKKVISLLTTVSADLKKATTDLATAMAANDSASQAAAQAQIDSLATQLEANTQTLADTLPKNAPSA